MRVKSHWNKRAKPQSLEEIAGALGFISWQIAAHGVLELENQGFTTHSQDHRLQIIAEFLAFLFQVADRLSYTQMADAERQRFITALAHYIADIFADNKRDAVGDGEHRHLFIDLLNQRANEYAELSFNEGNAGFDFLRYFGDQVTATLAGERWVSEYIVDVGAPEAIQTLKTGMKGLFSPRRETGTANPELNRE